MTTTSFLPLIYKKEKAMTFEEFLRRPCSLSKVSIPGILQNHTNIFKMLNFQKILEKIQNFGTSRKNRHLIIHNFYPKISR